MARRHGGRPEGAGATVQGGADPTASDKDGFGALHVAVQHGHLPVVERLLAAGADPNVTDKHGNGPLWTAGYQAGPGVKEDAPFEIAARLLAGARTLDT